MARRGSLIVRLYTKFIPKEKFMTEKAVSKSFFVRDATGLVRELSWFDTFLCAFGILNVGLGLVQSFVYAPFVFPGASIPIAFLIAIPGAFFLGLLNALFTAAMPRSGGDYVWVSRSINPMVGFAVNFFFTFNVLAAASINIWYFDSIFLAPALYAFGLKSAAAWITSTPTSALILGIPALALLAWMFSRGLQAVKKALTVLFAISMLGTLLWLGVMLFKSNAAFISSFNAALGANAYQNLIAAAQSAGFGGASGTTSGVNTFNAIIYAFQMYSGFQMIGYFAGEIKRINRSAIQAVMGALGVGALMFVGGAFLVVKFFGRDFVSALAYFNNTAPASSNLPLGNYLSSLVIYMTNNPLLRVLISLGFVTTSLWILLPQMLIVTRNLFAWSFDRLIPDWFAKVNDRTHSPVNATIVTSLLILVMLVITLTTSFWSYLVNLAGIGALVTIIVAVAAIVFPYRRKDIFEKAPKLVQSKILGLPVLVWSGIFTLIAQLVVVVICFKVPSIGGAVTWVSLLSSLSVFVLAFPLYGIIYAINKHRGLDPKLAYQELPPE
jgi:basic amino acid/polyamine antiporter, APA family